MLLVISFKISISRAETVIAVLEFRQATILHKSVHYIPFCDTYRPIVLEKLIIKITIIIICFQSQLVECVHMI